MRDLIDYLFRHPLLLVLLLGWAASAVGGILKRAAKGGAARRQAPPAASRPSPAAGRRPSAEEVAAEMRRILGMEPAAPAPAPARPAPRPVVRNDAPPELPPQPLRIETERRRLATQVESHVGERLQQRQGPQSGAVGREALGRLGGRVHERGAMRRGGSHLVDLSDLKRAFVLREVLDRPLALREDW